jgi:hypothetical protein
MPVDRGPVRVLLTIVGVASALATIVFANLGMVVSAACAAVVAVGFVAEGWRRSD